jgi:hypothetical protein
METGYARSPASALHAFTLRMAGHGFSVSSTLMQYDRVYALEQLQLAHTMADAKLREMSMALFAAFESGRLRPVRAAVATRAAALI